MSDVILYFSKVIENPLWFRIPLGYLILGTELKKNGIDVSIIDGNLEKKAKEKIALIANKNRKFIFGISAMTGYQIEDGLRMAKFIRKNYPKALLVWGGWHSSLLPHDTLKDDLVDCIVIGPGEEILVELVNAFKNNKDFNGIAGMGYKKNNQIIINEMRGFPDFSNYSLIKWDLINLNSYLMHDIAPRTVTYISSRGCPYRCGFCAIKTIYKRHWFPLPTARVISEFKYLKDNYGVDGIRFEDSNFFTSKKRVLELCEEMIKNNLNFKWSALARPNELIRYNQAELNLLKKAGLIQILVGAESADQDALDLITKDIKEPILNDMIKICFKNDISMILSYMVGFPIANGKDIDLTLNRIKSLHSQFPFGEKNNEILLFYYTPYPGSDLYQLALKYGFNEPATLKAWATLTLNEFHAPWITKKQDRKIQRAMKTYRIIKFYIRGAEMLENLYQTLHTKRIKIFLRFLVYMVYKQFKYRISHKIYFFPLARYLFYTFSKVPIFKLLRDLENENETV